jgi:hypothetical protein
MMSANFVFMNDGAVGLQSIFRNRCSAADCGCQNTGSLHRKIDTLSSRSFTIRHFERVTTHLRPVDHRLRAISEDA